MPKGAQKADNAFYLVDEEIKLLPPAVKKALSKRIKKELCTAYETPQQIDARMKAVSYKKFPKLQKKIDGYVAEIKAGKKPNMDFSDFPEEAIGTFLFSIGASGISFYIAIFISDPSFGTDKELIEAVAALSRSRHRILEKNEKVFA